MKVRKLYPAPAFIDIGSLKDNDPPVFEEVNEYLIPNAYINSNGYIFKNFKTVKEIISFRHRESITLKNIISNYITKKIIKINKPAISIMNGWNDSFYHFSLESLTKLYILREHINSATIVFPQNLKKFHSEWIEILGLKNITYIGNDEVVKTPLAISASFTSRDLNHHNLIIPEFRKWVLENIELLPSLNYKNIFIGRKNPMHRKILNLEEVKSILGKYNFVYLEMEDFSLKQQIKIFLEAEKIVALHGAALTNICFAKSGTKVIDLIHEDFDQWCYLKLANILNIKYNMLRCSGENNSNKLPGYKDLKVDINHLTSEIEI